MYRRGFSLLELAIVLSISTLMVGFVYTASTATSPTATAKCIAETQEKLKFIRQQIETFARRNDRLPMPAARNVGTTATTYGREASGADIDAVGSGTTAISYGALPWQALGIPTDYAGDCWKNKLTYVVNTALTTNATSGGFLDTTVDGSIILNRTDPAGTNVVTSNKIAYAIISHGVDGLGAVKLNYSAANAGGAPDTAHGWCSGTSIAKLNCNAVGNTLMEAAYNDGKDAGANYFDDIIVAAGKPKTLSSALYYLLSWGNGTYNTLANAYLNASNTGTKVNKSVTFTNFSMGLRNACGMTAAGAVYCWGANDQGQAGNGTYFYNEKPTLVSGGITFVSIDLNNSTTPCGLDASGNAYCWGWNVYGQAGIGSTGTNVLTPTAVAGGIQFSMIAAAGNPSCGLEKVTGKAYCWGYNYAGGIGNGTTTDSNVPVAVSGGLFFTSIVTGDGFACGLVAGGSAYCWGSNYYGTLGSGVVTGDPNSFTALSANQTVPTAVSGGLTFSKLRAGYDHVCGLNNVDGKWYCWGSNKYGMAGDGNAFNYYITPTLAAGGVQYVDIGGGVLHTCGITTEGVVNCWGSGTFGQNGSGSSGFMDMPIPLSDGRKFTSIAIGGNNTCATDAGGDIYCYGDNQNNALGSGVNSGYSGKGVVALGGLAFTKVSMSVTYACGVASDGDAYCWGANGTYQLGDGTAAQKSVPTKVIGGYKFVDVGVGTSGNSCGLTAAGAIYCWGAATGDGTATARSSPVAVNAPLGITFTQLSVGGSMSCGRTSTSDVYCWGSNTYGQLGNNLACNPCNSPYVTSGLPKFASISAGSDHVCGLTSGGIAYCWGRNSSGQIGDNTSGTNRNAPTAVTMPGGVTFTSISTGSNITCALTSDGTAYCWGLNATGTLGDGTFTSPRLVPTAVSGGIKFASIQPGSVSCGISLTGTMYCWGGAGPALGLGSGANINVPTAVQTDVTNFTPKYLVRSFSFATSVLVSAPTSCALPTGGTAINGWRQRFYQSSAPTGSCVSEYRECQNGIVTGSYTNLTCTPGCDARTVTWGSGPTCSATMLAPLAGGTSAPAPLNSTSGGTGSATVNCSTKGIVTLSGASCS